MAKDTKLWHNKVIRVAAVDCALVENDEICAANQVRVFPTFAFFKPFSTNLTGITINKTHDYVKGSEFFYGLIFEFLENLNEPKVDFPVLKPYEYVFFIKFTYSNTVSFVTNFI